MYCTVGKQFDFPAAHRNTSHEGHCSRIHGHTWILEVICRGGVQSAEGPTKGMVVDFATIKEVYETAVEPYVEHQFLNESIELPEYTTEHLAKWVFDRMKPHLSSLYAIKVWEGKTSYAIYDEGPPR